jgi:type II secretory pathway component GspD/PulD (secretin)
MHLSVASSRSFFLALGLGLGVTCLTGSAGAQSLHMAGQSRQNSPTPRPKPATPTRKRPKVTITAVGNRLIIQSDDPELLQMAEQLTRVYTDSSKGEGYPEIIHLRYADAVETAKVLDEALNGKTAAPANPLANLALLRSLLGRRGTSAPAPSPTPDTYHARVVADANSNSLLIRARPLDLLTIQQLVVAIDVPDVDSAAIMHTQLIGPLHYANANELADVLRNVFREQMDNNPTATNGGGRRRGRPLPNQNVDANGNLRGVTLTLGVDDRTNSLVVHCSDKTFADVEKLVRELELAAKNSTQTVRVVAIEGVNPALIQEAITAIQNSRNNTGTNRPNSNGTPGRGSSRGTPGRGGR